MLEAEISTLFGLTLIELVEHVAIGAISIAVTGLTIAIASLWVSSKQTANHSKISSANLILELLQPWRKDDFQQFLEQLHDPKITEYNEVKLEKFLNQLEDIAIFWKDKTLTEVHVKEFFGANLKTVRDDKFIQNYMKPWIEKNPDYYFVNLTKLIEKVKEWKI